MNKIILQFLISKSLPALLCLSVFPVLIYGQTVITRDPDKKAPESTNKEKTTGAENKTVTEDPELLKLEREAFDYLNGHRLKSKQKPLEWNENLAKLARKHSKEMAEKNFFSVNGPNGETIDEQVKEFGITKFTNLGRLVAANAGQEKPVEVAIDRWISSPERRQYLFDNPWSETGVGIFIGDDGMFYLTQDFLSK